MRKTVNYELTYFKKGQELKKVITIKFISNRVYDWYADVMERFNAIQTLTEKRKIAIENMMMAAVNSDVPFLERRKNAKVYKDELKEIEKELKSTDSKDFVKARFKLIERILTDNGVEDPELLSIDFWNDHVEPVQLFGFLLAAITKDTTGSKKKAK